MQRAYKLLPVAEGEPPAVQRVAYPDGTPIGAVAERMGWLLEPPAGAAIYAPTGELEEPAATLPEPSPEPEPQPVKSRKKERE